VQHDVADQPPAAARDLEHERLVAAGRPRRRARRLRRQHQAVFVGGWRVAHDDRSAVIDGLARRGAAGLVDQRGVGADVALDLTGGAAGRDASRAGCHDRCKNVSTDDPHGARLLHPARQG